MPFFFIFLQEDILFIIFFSFAQTSSKDYSVKTIPHFIYLPQKHI